MKTSDEKRARLRQAWTVVRGVFAVLLAIVSSWTLVYWLSSLLRRSAPVGSSEFYAQLVGLLIAFVFMAIVMSVISRFLGPRRRDFFLELSDAMRQIAQGNYSVSVPIELGDNPFGRVASSLNEMAESLEKMEKMRQEFISDVSHEIQSPLTAISGFARALRADVLTAEERLHYLSIIEAESGRLSRLSDSLLKLSALDSTAQTPALRRFKLDGQLRTVVLSAEPQWQEKEIELSAELSSISLVGDDALLDQVWHNLIQNAVKFTPRGGSISIELRASGATAQVRISDTGIGIAAADLPLVFDRFFKADRSRTSANAGSGLGLSIAAKIVALHGGAIRAESDGPGRGARFIVELPIEGPAAAPPRVPDFDVSAARPTSS